MCFLALSFWTNDARAIGTNFVIGYGKSTASLGEFSVPNTSSNHRGGVFGFGALFHQFILLDTDIELGILYLQRGFSLNINGQEQDQSFDSVHFPVLLKFYFLPVVFFGIGGYFTHALAQTNPTLYSANDRGWLISAGVKPQITSSTYLLVDFRYLFGIANVSQIPGSTLYLRDLQFLFGLSFGY